jgi:hypothetical protein
MPLAYFDAMPAHAAVAAGLGGAIAGVAMLALRRARGTTLAAPAAWAVAAAAVYAAVELALAVNSGWEGTPGASLARYAAAAGSCCPIMAVLGAKRPQDRGWQWVVLSLWVVLLVPAGQAWAAGVAGRFAPSMIWRGLVVVLVALVPLNYSPTRHAASALAFTAGQIGLLAPFLAPNQTPADDAAVLRVGGLLFVLLAALRALWTSNARTSPAWPSGDRFQWRWLNFRDGWGAFWGLRVMNRVNETAELSGWPVQLQWRGFVGTDGKTAAINEHVAIQIEQAMDSLLRRFERAAV